MSTPKEEYVLGEPVRLDVRFTKTRDFDADFGDVSQDELFRVFIAKGRGGFLRYIFKGWDVYRKPTWDGATGYSYDTIFFNSKPVTYHLSDYGRREAEKGRILTDYAFPEPGDYRIKAILGFDRIRAEVESNEVSIRVKQPEGDDLRVWEIMNSDPQIGYFMTKGQAPTGFPWSRSAEDDLLQPERVLQEVDRITSEYPDSYLAGLLKVKAHDHRARRERIKQENERERLHRESEKAAASRKN